MQFLKMEAVMAHPITSPLNSITKEIVKNILSTATFYEWKRWCEKLILSYARALCNMQYLIWGRILSSNAWYKRDNYV